MHNGVRGYLKSHLNYYDFQDFGHFVDDFYFFSEVTTVSASSFRIKKQIYTKGSGLFELFLKNIFNIYFCLVLL